MPDPIESSSVALKAFHPAVRNWFKSGFSEATPVQIGAWQRIREGGHVLIAAPTGSGKTFAAFLEAIGQLVAESENGPLDDSVRILYVSPLKALSNDIEKNLKSPLEGIDQWLEQNQGQKSGIRAMVRTGDTTPGEREKMRRRPPQILVTTPESLYLLLTSDSGRRMLSTVSTVIVDEIHAVAGSKRGSHLSLSLARLDALTISRTGKTPDRVGLSATQRPIKLIAKFLTGGQDCSIVDSGHNKQRDIRLELPSSPLTAVMANEVWEEIYDRLAELALARRTTLIFVNTRRLAERLARHLAERIGEKSVTAHHGSLARKHRLEAEQALKAGKLKALVATASLELGIDIGDVDLVCQLGSPGSISALIQRVGRAGHGVGEVSHGRLFPLTCDDLVECVALVHAMEKGELDRIQIPQAPLDVLAQQVVAEVSAREWLVEDFLHLVRSAWPYRGISEEEFEKVLDMLAGGYATSRGRRAAYIHHDSINGRLRSRRAARLTSLQNGGVIPDQFDYEVTLLPGGYRVGTLNEDFAFESIPGDIFQLGNTSYRVLKIETARVLVEDAQGLPPSIPFWLGDRPGRSNELSLAVSQLREAIDEQMANGAESLADWLAAQGIQKDAAEQVAGYLGSAHEALDGLPTQNRVIMERFFDDTGDMHLVIHAPFGSRIMRAWGLALRKRFCRQFNFELQAAALEDCLILSLGETHSFDIDDVKAYLNPATVRDVLIQALLDAPMFEIRWRWNATVALAVQRMRNGQRLPPQWQRNAAEDLVAVVFPDQIACLENIRGEREIPDHPLVTQTIDDCLTDAMDIDGLLGVLNRIRDGSLEVRGMDLTAPSPLSSEIINARPYAFLDDGDAENRRTRAISQRPQDFSDASLLRIISVEATDQVRAEAWINPRNPDELHDGLLQTGFLTASEFSSRSWNRWFTSLAEEMRAVHVTIPDEPDSNGWWLATERLSEWLTIHPDSDYSPDPAAVFDLNSTHTAESALIELLRSRLSALGPVTVTELVKSFSLQTSQIDPALLALQSEGSAVAIERSEGERQWCDRRLLARIHRYSRERRRRASKPVSPAAFMNFLVRWHALDEPASELEQPLSQLEGWCAPVAAWEHGLLDRRSVDYNPLNLDQQFLSGALTWFRPPIRDSEQVQLVSATPIALVPRGHAIQWRMRFSPTGEGLPAAAAGVLESLRSGGAMFVDDLAQQAGMLPEQLESVLATLVAQGYITSDGFSPLRWLTRSATEKAKIERRIRRTRSRFRTQGAGHVPLGRWSAITDANGSESGFDKQDRMATICSALLRRYGVVFRAVLQRENLLPHWRDLLYYLRRMEDRGEVNGGRFVDGFSGEQFALPEATGLLRKCAKGNLPNRWTVINATDPLNLGGFITPGVKTVSRVSNRILLDQGVPAARIVGNEIEILKGASRDTQKAAEIHLVGTSLSSRVSRPESAPTENREAQV
ncbi:MAG TPA: DEAD/DEAH box helicase [Xanthomonadales bacterium]|nr:DEAD/DEAH box helicase [Xanthomonadales bacterium]